MSNTQKRLIPYSDFDMISVKYNSKTGVVCKYVNKDTGRTENPEDTKHAPHPDFLNALSELAPHVGYILGLQNGWDYAREELRNDFDKLGGARKGGLEAEKAFTVSGIRLAGEGKNASVKITGSLKCKTGAIGLASPLINFQNTAMAIEQTIEKLCEKVKEETYSYLFTGKVAAKQEEMDFDESNDPDVDQPIGKKKKKPGKQTDIITESEAAENAAAETESEEEGSLV